MNFKVKVIGPADRLGRVPLILEWNDPDKPYCSVCGKCRSIGCAHSGTEAYSKRGQHFLTDEPGRFFPKGMLTEW